MTIEIGAPYQRRAGRTPATAGTPYAVFAGHDGMQRVAWRRDDGSYFVDSVPGFEGDFELQPVPIEAGQVWESTTSPLREVMIAAVLEWNGTVRIIRSNTAYPDDLLVTSEVEFRKHFKPKH